MNFKNPEKTESIKKLVELSKERKSNVDVTPDIINNLIGCIHCAGVELVHLIKSEDRIEIIDDVPEEIKEFNGIVSKEWLETVVEPFCKNIIEFMERHPEYCLRIFNVESNVATTKGLLYKELRNGLRGLL